MKPSAPVGPVEFSDIKKDSVVISWKPSENDGGSPITGYYIEMREAPKSSWQRVKTVDANVTTYCIENVKENKEYFFNIYAENTVGRSDALTSSGVTIKSKFGNYINSLLHRLFFRSRHHFLFLDNIETIQEKFKLSFECS